MHKRLVNHCTIELTLIPQGPVLIKAGKEGADPTKPDMEFVETYHAGGRSIYFPGSSLKGAIRAHAERIVRTVGSDRPSTTQPWASDPLDLKTDHYKALEKLTVGSEIFKQSSFTDQIFGNTSIASRLRIEDAYPDINVPLKLEERNGVAIDRVFGSVAVGPFNFEVCTAGAFKTKIHLKNFTLAQLGLIGLVLRDLDDGWFGLGFGKSRGLGTVTVRRDQAVVHYPSCILENGQIRQLGSRRIWPSNRLLGMSEFLDPDERAKYGFGQDGEDWQTTPIAAEEMRLGLGVQQRWIGNGEEGVPDLFLKAVRAWRDVLEEVPA